MNKDNYTPEATSPAIGVATSLSPSTSVSAALDLMEQLGQRAMVVLDGDRPIGVVTAIALRHRDNTNSPDAEVQDVMEFEVVHVDPSSGVEDTLRRYKDAAWHSVRRRHPFAPHAHSG